MIRETFNADKKLAVTSDHWHVVHARWSGAPGTPSFDCSIVSEHADSTSAVQAARELKLALGPGMASRARETRDQVIVRRPSAESLKSAGRLEKRKK